MSVAPSGNVLAQSDARDIQPAGNCIAPLLEFVSDLATGEVYVYNNGTTGACLVISHIPQARGMDVNSVGTLYVASATSHRIFVFKPPYTTVSQIISDGIKMPGDVALCKGYIAATNLTTRTVTIFSYAGAILRTLSAPVGVKEAFATCDPAGNLYTDGTSAAGTSVVEFKNGIGAPNLLNVIATSVTSPGGLEWEQGALWIDDPTSKSVSSWPPPFTLATKIINLSGALKPVKFEIDPTDSRILSADAGLDKGIFYDMTGTPVGFLNPFIAGGSLVGANYNKDDSP